MCIHCSSGPISTANFIKIGRPKVKKCVGLTWNDPYMTLLLDMELDVPILTKVQKNVPLSHTMMDAGRLGTALSHVIRNVTGLGLLNS